MIRLRQSFEWRLFLRALGQPNPGQIEVTRKLQRDLSSIDILIQNAATFMAGPLEQAKLEDLMRFIGRTFALPLR